MKEECSYGLVNRTMINNLTKTVENGIKGLKDDIGSIKEKNEQVFNHMSNRLPPWASIIIAIFIAIVSASIGSLLK